VPTNGNLPAGDWMLFHIIPYFQEMSNKIEIKKPGPELYPAGDELIFPEPEFLIEASAKFTSPPR
jgi:hypothetical protein